MTDKSRLADALRDLLKANADASEDEIAEVLAVFDYRPPLREVHRRARVDAMVLQHVDDRIPHAKAFEIIAAKRYGKPNPSGVLRIVKGGEHRVNVEADPEYYAMTEAEIRARFNWLMGIAQRSQ